jgi:uncharacterized membrane protein
LCTSFFKKYNQTLPLYPILSNVNRRWTLTPLVGVAVVPFDPPIQSSSLSLIFTATTKLGGWLPWAFAGGGPRRFLMKWMELSAEQAYIIVQLLLLLSSTIETSITTLK